MLSLEEQIERIADAAMAASLEADHAAVVPARARFRRRGWVGVAAAVMLVGLVGVLIGVVANRDRPPGTADDPAPTTAPTALGQSESLSSSDWVVATVLPDGVVYLYPLAGEGGASKTVWYGTQRTDGSSEQLRVSAGMQEPLGTGEPVDIDGNAWTVSQPGSGGWNAARPVGTDVVSVSAPGSFDDTARAVLAGLVVIPESALPSEPLGPRERAIEVVATEFDGLRYSLASSGVQRVRLHVGVVHRWLFLGRVRLVHGSVGAAGNHRRVQLSGRGLRRDRSRQRRHRHQGCHPRRRGIRRRNHRLRHSQRPERSNRTRTSGSSLPTSGPTPGPVESPPSRRSRRHAPTGPTDYSSQQQHHPDRRRWSDSGQGLQGDPDAPQWGWSRPRALARRMGLRAGSSGKRANPQCVASKRGRH